MKEEFTPGFYSRLFEEPLYKVDDQTAVKAQEDPPGAPEETASSQAKEYTLVEGTGDLLVVAQVRDGAPLPQDQHALLTKILKAVGYTLDDQTLLTIDHRLPEDFDMSRFAYQLFFVKNTGNFSEHLPGNFYDISSFESHLSMAAHELGVLKKNEDYKRALWTMLQKVFRPK
jgi:DNA polymerase III psi subunit